MSLKYIRDHYGVPAKRGGRVRYNKKLEGQSPVRTKPLQPGPPQQQSGEKNGK